MLLALLHAKCRCTAAHTEHRLISSTWRYLAHIATYYCTYIHKENVPKSPRASLYPFQIGNRPQLGSPLRESASLLRVSGSEHYGRGRHSIFLSPVNLISHTRHAAMGFQPLAS